MDISGCVKYRKWNHRLELFGTLHALTHAHTEQIWYKNVRWRSSKENAAKLTILLFKIIHWKAAYIYYL